MGQETGRVFLDEMDIAAKEFAAFEQIKIIDCGTSWPTLEPRPPSRGPVPIRGPAY